MRISDWSSDVCSSDLGRGGLGRGAVGIAANRAHPLPASPCLRRGRGQGKSPRFPPFLQRHSWGAGINEKAGRVPGLSHRSLRQAAVFFCSAIHRSEEHTSELQSLMRISYAVFCLKKKTKE